MARKKSSRKRANNSPKLYSRILIILGITIFLLGTFFHFQIFTNLLIAQRERPKNEFVAENPKSIFISSLGLNIPVIEGGIIAGTWILSDDKALYLPTSGKIGEGYNTIIYAHKRRGLFENLSKINTGDLIVVNDNKNREFIYSTYSVENINGKDVGKLYSKEKNILTLFTCDGWFDRERLLVRGKLILSTPSTK